MRSCHNLSAGFDDPNLVSCAGLIPVMNLAERAGLHDLAATHVRVPGSAGSNADVKVTALVAGMVAGADTIDAMDLLRHGGMGRVLTGGRAPSTLGTFLRSFTFGHVRQLDAVASRALVIAATRLRRGPTNSAKGAARLVADALVTAAKAGATGQVTVRSDSAYYNHDVIAAARTGGARFSITARMDPAVTRAITTISDDAWVGIKYPHAIYDEEEQRWVSDAEVAEIGFTAFTSRRHSEHIGARLIVRRVKRLNPTTVPAGQGALFSAWRHHAVFTDSREAMLAAEATHRDHAIIEKVIAELKNGPLAHLPSGQMNANAAWLVLAAISFNLTRAAGTLASKFHARATTATIRAQLIAVPARIARSARRSCLHLPAHWPWQDPWTALHAAATGPPATATT